MEMRMREIIVDNIIDQGRNPTEDQAFQHQITDLFMDVDQDHAVEFLQRIAD